MQEAVFLAHARAHYETAVRAVSSLAYVAVSVWLIERGADVPDVLLVFVAFEGAVTIAYFVLIAGRIASLRVRPSAPTARGLARELRPYAASAGLAALFSHRRS